MEDGNDDRHRFVNKVAENIKVRHTSGRPANTWIISTSSKVETKHLGSFFIISMTELIDCENIGHTMTQI